MPSRIAEQRKWLLTVWVPHGLKQKLDGFADTVDKPRSAVLRALLSRATVEDLPASWRGLSEEERQWLHSVER